MSGSTRMSPGGTPLKPSILDRLIGDMARDRGDASRDPLPCFVPRIDRFNEAELRECLLRDIGWLLNDIHFEAAVGLGLYPEIASSVLNAGLEELGGKQADPVSIAARGRAIATALRTFEPRLVPATIEVTIDTRDLAIQNKLNFIIHARFVAELGEDYVELSTAVDVDTGQVEVAI
jgi:type VI secretion system protein ImpF